MALSKDKSFASQPENLVQKRLESRSMLEQAQRWNSWRIAHRRHRCAYQKLRTLGNRSGSIKRRYSVASTFEHISAICSLFVCQFRSRTELALEIVVLQHRLGVSHRHEPDRRRPTSYDRLLGLLYRLWPGRLKSRQHRSILYHPASHRTVAFAPGNRSVPMGHCTALFAARP